MASIIFSFEIILLFWRLPYSSLCLTLYIFFFQIIYFLGCVAYSSMKLYISCDVCYILHWDDIFLMTHYIVIWDFIFLMRSSIFFIGIIYILWRISYTFWNYIILIIKSKLLVTQLLYIFISSNCIRKYHTKIILNLAWTKK